MPEAPSLTLRRCGTCGAFEPARRTFCAACGSDGLRAAEVAGESEVVSWTVVRRPATAFRHLGQIPVVVVRLDAGVSITGRFEGDEAGLFVGAKASLLRTDDGVPVFGAGS
jgi:uncharacterized OB-fold protein